MRPSRSSLSLLGLLVAMAPAARAQLDQSAQAIASAAEGALFLLVPVGGRATALGQAAAADGGTSEAAFWNPAGLASMENGEFAVHYARTFASNNTVITAFASNHRIGVFGVSGYLVDLGTQGQRTGPGPPTGTFSAKNIELLASYATDITRALSVGLNYKLIQFRRECAADCGIIEPAIGTTQAIDVGVQYGFGRDFRLGAVLQHAGFKLQVNNRDQADPLPTRIQIGAMYRIHLPPPKGLPQGVDARFLVDLREAWGSYGHPDLRVGADVGVGDLLRLRTGYAFLEGEAGGPSVGIGVRAGRITIDLAQVFLTSDTFDQPIYVSFHARL